MNSSIERSGGNKLAVRPEPAMALPFDTPVEMTLADVCVMLRKRRWLITGMVAVVVLATALYSVLTTPKYEAVARIAISPEGSEGLTLDDIKAPSLAQADPGARLGTELKIIQSDSLGLQVMRDLNLGRQQLLTGNTASPVEAVDSLTPQRQAKVVNIYHKNLSTTVLPKSQVLEIRFRNPNPELAAKVANTLVNDYVEQSFKTRFESAKQVSEWLTGQLSELKVNAQKAQEQLAAFQKANGLLGTDEKDNIVTAKLQQLNDRLTATEADRILKEARYRLTTSQDPELMSAVVPSSALQLLRAQQVDLRNQYTQASAKFGPQYPKVLELKEQLAQIDSGIAAEVKNAAGRITNDYLAAQKSEDMLRKQFEEQKQKAYELNSSAVQYGLLKREVDSSRDLYEGLLKKLKEAGVTAGLRSTNVRVVDSARIPAEPVEPNIPLNLALALGGSLAGGIMLAFILESVDDTIGTAEESEVISGLPSLAIIPRHKPLSYFTGQQLTVGTTPSRTLPVLTFIRPNSHAAESYRALRSSLLLSSTIPPKVIVITSSLPQEGKSMTSLNCAVVLAQKGARVLLVDGDMRRPTIHQSLHLRADAGLSSVLKGMDDASVLVSLPELPNLTVMPAGPRSLNAAELVASERMQGLLAKWRNEYDHIVIDTPPVATVTDATILSAQADAVLIIIRSGHTRRQTLRRTRDMLLRTNANIAGVVVNAANLNSPEHYGYYAADLYYSDYEGDKNNETPRAC